MERLEENGVTLTIKRFQPMLVRPDGDASKGFYFLSNLDQNISVIMQTIHCFNKADEEERSECVSEVLREALAKVLVHFYPLAGKLRISSDGKLIVECTGDGVPFVEAVAENEMEVLGDITEMPNPTTLEKLVHISYQAANVLETPLVTIQVTRFKCGGFVLGMAMNHCMADGVSAVEFLKSWAQTARGLPLTTPPLLDRRVLIARQPPRIEFPHHEFEEIEDVSNLAGLYNEQQIEYRSFCFNPAKLGELKMIAMNEGTVNKCTNFTLLAAFVWRARSKALCMAPNQKTKLLFAVDGRSKLDPPLKNDYFGNVIILTCCHCSVAELLERPLSFAVQLVQDAIKRVTGDYIRSGIDFFEVKQTRPSLTGTLVITMWSRLNFGDVDFGWGRWKQTGPGTLPEKEVALFLPRGEEKMGINLVLGLPVSSMKIFKELIEM